MQTCLSFCSVSIGGLRLGGVSLWGGGGSGSGGGSGGGGNGGRVWHFLCFLVKGNVCALLAEDFLSVVVGHHCTTVDLTSTHTQTEEQSYSISG